MSEALKKARAAAITERVIKIVVCAVIGALGSFLASKEGAVMALIGFVIGFAIGWWAYSILGRNRKYAAFVSLYKKEMIDTALRGSYLFDEMQFQYNCGINPEAVNESGLISARLLFSDCFLSGKYRDIAFVQADVRNARGQRGGYTVEYDGTYAIIPVKLPDAVQTNIADKDVDISYIVSGKTYKTGNAEFDKAFKVYTTDFNKAAQLLSPAVISRLMSIRQRMSGKMAVTVKNGNMYIFMSRKGSPLKPGLFKQYDEEMRESILAEVSRVKLFIDAFSTNNVV